MLTREFVADIGTWVDTYRKRLNEVKLRNAVEKRIASEMYCRLGAFHQWLVDIVENNFIEGNFEEIIRGLVVERVAYVRVVKDNRLWWIVYHAKYRFEEIECKLLDEQDDLADIS